MTEDIDEMKAILEDYEQTPHARGMDLRLDLAEIILGGLKAKGWTQRQLAEKAMMKEQYVTRLVHSSQNCTLDMVGRILFALGLRAKLQVEEPPPATETDGDVIFVESATTQDPSNGQEEIFEISEGTEANYRFTERSVAGSQAVGPAAASTGGEV